MSGLELIKFPWSLEELICSLAGFLVLDSQRELLPTLGMEKDATNIVSNALFPPEARNIFGRCWLANYLCWLPLLMLLQSLFQYQYKTLLF